MHVLEANKVRRDRQGERGAARRWCERPTMSRGEECASMRSMKRGWECAPAWNRIGHRGAWTVRREEGKYVFVVGTLG